MEKQLTDERQDLLTPAAACRQFGVCRNTLIALRERGLVKAENLNPGGKRAVWRYHNHLETQADTDHELKYLDLKWRLNL